MAQAFLTQQERTNLTKIVVNLDEFIGGSSHERQVLLQQAGLHKFLPGIVLAGKPRTVAGDLIGKLETHGYLEEQPSHHALGSLLSYLLTLGDLSGDDSRFLAELMVKYELVLDPVYTDALRSRYSITTAAQPIVAVAHERGLEPAIDSADNGMLTPSAGDAEAAALVQADITRESFEPVTVPIAAGPFLMGSAPGAGIPGHETPQHEVHLPDYRIGKYPVMNCEYERFLRATKRLATPEMRWDGQSPFKGEERRPVSGVTWCDAMAYCQWLSAATQRRYTLPSEAHWEKAARGADGRPYPWGEWEPGRCNQGAREVAAVDAYPPQSVYGCYDMVGNVPEWTSSLWGKDPREPDERCRYPWQLGERDDLGANSQVRRIVRGGAAMDPPERVRCAARVGHLPLQPGSFGKRHGFRVMMEVRPAGQMVPFCEVEGRQP